MNRTQMSGAMYRLQSGRIKQHRRMGQLTKQIEKAQGKNEPDQVVAVMKEVKKLLAKIQKQEENHAA